MWVGSAKRDLLTASPDGLRAAGRELERVQRGGNPTDWKPMPSVGRGAREIRVRVSRFQQSDGLMASALVAFRSEEWKNAALTPNAILRVEVQLPPITHDVPLKAIERWANGPSVSPREEVLKRPLRTSGR